MAGAGRRAVQARPRRACAGARLAYAEPEAYSEGLASSLRHLHVLGCVCILLHLFFSDMGKPWKTHLKDLPNAAAFAAKAAGQNQGCRKMEEIKEATLRKKAALQGR